MFITWICTRNFCTVGGDQDLYSLFIRKMQDAPPQEVTIVGDDWEEQREDEGGGAQIFQRVSLWSAEWQDV